jgi:uncharacterized protein (TIGR02271 family)
MFNETEIREIIGTTAYGSDDEKIGKVGQVYLDDETGQPEFVTVNTGFFGSNESFVPVGSATLEGDTLRVPFTKDKVKNAPNVDIDQGHMDEGEEAELLAYYGIGSAVGSGVGGRADTDTDTSAGTAATDTGTGFEASAQGHDTSGPDTDDAMTLSEERVRVGTASQEAGRVRLRKYVTTETETHTIPVRKERAVLEREPITDANAGDALAGPDISEEEHEVVLSEERPVVEKTVEPVERVRLGTETVTEQETVTEEVRKENLDTDGDVAERS